jgi:hypothetical protein
MTKQVIKPKLVFFMIAPLLAANGWRLTAIEKQLIPLVRKHKKHRALIL